MTRFHFVHRHRAGVERLETSERNLIFDEFNKSMPKRVNDLGFFTIVSNNGSKNAKMYERAVYSEIFKIAMMPTHAQIRQMLNDIKVKFNIIPRCGTVRYDNGKFFCARGWTSLSSGPCLCSHAGCESACLYIRLDASMFCKNH
jgi:hypothetical protein